LKKTLFLIIAALLVIGLALPGCGGTTPSQQQEEEEEEPEGLTIQIAIVGPMGFIQGDNMWYGAEMAVDELGAETVAGRPLTIELMQVDAQEMSPPSADYPGQQVDNAIANGADFIVGGFRTEATIGEVEAAMDAETMMFVCGSATGDILKQVNDDYDRYKYLFRGIPMNETFLFMANIAMCGMVGYAYMSAVQSADPSVVRVAFLAEDLTWTVSPRAAVEATLASLGFTYVGTVECSPNAEDLTTQMNELQGLQPNIIFTFVSGPVGITYGKAMADSALQVPAITVGINVEAQDPGFWDKCSGDAANNGAEGMIAMMTYAPDVEQTAETGPFLAAWAAAHPEQAIPVYTAASYDIIKGLVLALQDTATVDTESDAVVFSNDDLVAWFEDPANAQVTTSGSAGYYTLALQPLVDAGVPCYAHDLIYGPEGDATGMGVQWQDDGTGNGKLVGVWPNAAFDAVNQGIFDGSGIGPALGMDWTGFTYDGIEMFSFPLWIMQAWGWV
jgi:branched-chain amino acid transport system substrate-binding protein